MGHWTLIDILGRYTFVSAKMSPFRITGNALIIEVIKFVEVRNFSQMVFKNSVKWQLQHKNSYFSKRTIITVKFKIPTIFHFTEFSEKFKKPLFLQMYF